jgi:predicted NUDIX family phosphoesterase
MGMGGTMMATTSAERMREHRTRRHRRDIQLKIDVSETELREIALRGYAGAASANRKAGKRQSRSLSATSASTSRLRKEAVAAHEEIEDRRWRQAQAPRRRCRR